MDYSRMKYWKQGGSEREQNRERERERENG